MRKAVRSYLRSDAESVPRFEMERIQTERLRAGLERVSTTVPFYKEKLAQLQITAANIRSTADLRKLPFTLKTDLRENYPFGLLAVPMKDVVRIHASSGTTGKPTVVAYTAN